jgi:hypothetical protein
MLPLPITLNASLLLNSLLRKSNKKTVKYILANTVKKCPALVKFNGISGDLNI